MGAVGRRLVSPHMVGRAEELSLLVSAVSEPPAVVVVEGEAGIGKTRLISELQAHPKVSDRRFAVGVCRRIREPFPLGPVLEAIRGAGDILTAAALSPVAGSLRPLLPEIAEFLPPEPATLHDRVAEQHRVFRGLVDVLGSLTPAVLVLEDLHWADERTLDFLNYLLGEPPPKLSVLLTFRGEEVSPAVRVLTAKLPPTVTRAHVVATPLDADQTGALAAAILGIHRVSEEFAAYLCERASGLPFAIEELLAVLRARGTLVHRSGRWARKTLDELDVPLGIRDSVLERVARLSDDARAVAEAAAVLQTPAPIQALVGTCRVERARALHGLDEVLESGLFAYTGDGVGFRHQLAAQAVYESIPRPRRHDVHGRAAAELKRLDPIPLGQVAHHLRHADLLDEWVAVAEQAADQAITLGHDDEAARLLEDLLRAPLVEGDRRAQLAVKLGWSAVNSLQFRDVTDLISAALEEDLPSPLRGELWFRLGLLLEHAGADPVRQRQAHAEVVKHPDLRPDVRAWAMIGLGVPIVPDVPLAEHLTWLRRAVSATVRSTETRRICRSHGR